MKKIFSLLIVIMIALPAHSQRKANVGVFAGTSYYMGDMNPNRHFYKPGPSLGILYRYNLNKFYALRANVYYATLSGNPDDFSRLYYTGIRESFNVNLLDAAAQFEINFFSFIPNSKMWNATPYIAGGLGYSFATDGNRHMTLPFGIGMKLNVSRRISTGIEWSFRKTANDNIDGVENRFEYAPLHNNDWYSFAGIFITYKFFNFAADCPAYE